MKYSLISIYITNFNYGKFLEKSITSVLSQTINNYELIIIDDGSTDNSEHILEKYKKYQNIKIIFHDHNQGKGAALANGIGLAIGDIVLIQDADLEYDPSEYPNLLKPILDGYADVVYGSRFSSGKSRRVLYFWHSIGNRVLTLVSNMLTDLNLTDMETCYKVFRREIIGQLKLCEKRFGIEPEITAKISRLNPRPRVYEVGISYNGRTYSEGKKITWRDGFRAIYCILRYNLLP